ncbi:hypothetical protein [Bdellovibrio sp. HCB2-146]|uniref:hypothetical protein n=1 Tax=Bdellovibrio sp. HCB2-146 TaxID=3394362 RepID=UPI0039BC3196
MQVLASLFSFVILAFSLPSLAQVMPLGVYEGLMGNTGVAATHSTAASYYNPSLLVQRQKNALSINGNTIGTSNSRSEGSTLSSSLGFSPSYLSTILVGDALVHEFFLATTLQGQYNWATTKSGNTLDSDLNLNQVVTGYSMAFRSLPLALQVLGRYSEAKSYGVSEFSDPANNLYTVSKVKTEFKNLNLALGISAHFRFDSYTLGINFNTRGVNLHNQNEGKTKIYRHGPLPNEYVVTETDLGRTSVTNEEGKLAIGNGFKVGNHEFLTDSFFVENSNSLDSYNFTQTFGYRYGLAGGHQLLCGIGHSFGSDVKYVGQNFNSSVGYSWKTRQLRSAVGLYYSSNNTTIEASTAGVVFGSEYEY